MRVRNRAALAALSIVAASTFGLTACATSPAAPATSSKPPAAAKPSETPTTDAAAADLVGPGCAAYAKAVPTGDGSISGMSQLPVADAAAGNPLLKTLVAAVSGKLNPKVDLVSTLNGGEFTVFAPVDAAFAKLPAKTVKALGTPAGADTLKTVLTYHVVPGQIAPDMIAGDHKTVQGKDVKVTGSGDDLKVNDAKVICGGVHTANATVYLIDSVLMPPSK